MAEQPCAKRHHRESGSFCFFGMSFLKTRIPTDRMTCLEGKFTRWGACGYDSKFTLVTQGGLQLIWLLPELENHGCRMVVSESFLDSTRRMVESWLSGGWMGGTSPAFLFLCCAFALKADALLFFWMRGGFCKKPITLIPLF